MIKDVKEKNNKVNIESIRKERIDDLIMMFIDKNGNFDLENFKKYVTDNGNDFIKEGYGLNFLGKKAAELMSGLDSTAVFVEDKEHNEKEENKNSENIYISADNLEALRHLRYSYYGKIKCIYIDPPYNTGSDGFCYNDSFSYDKKDLMDKLGIDEDEANRILSMQNRHGNSHSAWLSFMYARLLIARDLLSDDGCIFISIDNNELSNLVLLCNTIFGEYNNIDTICLKTKASSGASGGGEDKKLKKNHEYVAAYCKNKDKLLFNKPKEKIEIEKFINEHEEEDIGFYYTRILVNPGQETILGEKDGIKIIEHSNYEFSTVKEKMKEENLSISEVYYKYFDKIFMVTNSQSSIPAKVNDFVDEKNKLISFEYIPSTGKDKEKLTKKFIWNETLVVWFKDSAIKENNKVYKLEEEGTLWTDISWGRLDVETQVPFKNGVKPIKLIERLINLVVDKNDIIMDFFSGSGSTAHAVLENNAKTGKNNHYILVQINESLDDSFKRADSATKKYIQKQIDFCDSLGKEHTIPTIAMQRINLASKKIKEEIGTDIDYGFKHYTLVKKDDEVATLNLLEKYNPNIAEITQDKILNEFSIESRLITFLCDDGFGLTPKYEIVDLNGYRAYYIEKSLYLLDKGFDIEQNKALVKFIEKNEVNRLVIYGYAFSTREMQQLKDNLEKFDLDDENIDIKY